MRRVFVYLAVGGWNTVFGVGLYTILYGFFGNRDNYLWLQVPTFLLSVTNAYVCYKIFVFKTKGNILHEYFKCYLVYGASSLFNAGLLWLLVTWQNMNPALANVITTFFTVVASYLGHKFFSFRERKQPSDGTIR